MSEDKIELTIHVKPGSKIELITMLESVPPLIKIHLRAPPSRGKANKAIINILSDSLQIPSNTMKIISGHTSRTKIVEIDCMRDYFEKWLANLEDENVI